MSGMFNLGNVFQLVIDSLDYGPFTKQDSVIHRPDTAFHIVFQFGNQLYSVNEQFVEQVFADISFVADKFSIDEFDECFHFQRLAVIDIAGRNHKVQDFTPVVANQMQFKPVEPAQRTFAALRYTPENLVHMYPLVAAYAQQGAVNEADAGAFAQQTFLYKDDKLHHHRFLQFREPVV